MHSRVLQGTDCAGPRLQVRVADLGENACLVTAVRQAPDQLQVVRRHGRHLPGRARARGEFGRV